MKKTISFPVICLLLLSTLYAADGRKTKLNHTIDRTSEETVYARINLDQGFLKLRSSSALSGVFSGEFLYDNDKPEIKYSIVNDEGQLVIELSDDDYNEDEINIDLDDFDDNECQLNFASDLPLALNMKCGLLRGNIDFSDLRVVDYSLTAAAAKATVDFGKPNATRMEHLDIENGVGKLTLYNLGNANFESFDFEAGIGSYELDFSGELKRSADVDIELGMGSMIIYLPRDAAARIEIDQTFLSSLDIDGVFKNGDTYTTENWEKADIRLNMRVTCNVGELAFKWTD